MTTISKADLEIIRNAKQVLETESIAQKISAKVAGPVDALMRQLPDKTQGQISKALNVSLIKASKWAMATAGSKKNPFGREDWMHKAAVGVSGFLGGFGGVPSTVLELPFSTMLMLRSIGCIAEAEGHDAADPQIRLSCVSVLAMGADPEKVQGDELSYWVARKTMAGLVAQAAEWSGKGAVPAMAKFLVEVGKRFGIVVSAKVAAQIAPALGGAAGAGINVLYLEHFQNVAHAHFGIERLCTKYGEATVQAAYRSA